MYPRNCSNNSKSVALTNIVHNLSAMGWAFFPGIYSTLDIFGNLHSKIVVLFEYDMDKHVGVVEKIRAFISRIEHKALADIVRMPWPSKIANMWLLSDVLQEQRKKCEEVCGCHACLIIFKGCHSKYIVQCMSFNMCHSTHSLFVSFFLSLFTCIPCCMFYN